MIKTTVSLMKLFISMVILSILSGCFDDTTEIESYIAQVQESTRTYIAPMPEITPFIHTDYLSGDLRSPFVLPKREAIYQKVQQMAGCLSPDSNRRKQPLEKYSLNALTMRGTLGDDKALWVLIEASDKSLHRVAVGSYLGIYNGRITSVTAKAVKIIELAPDGKGCWAERETTLNIIQPDKPKK